jgi:hypothetical protein
MRSTSWLLQQKRYGMHPIDRAGYNSRANVIRLLKAGKEAAHPQSVVGFEVSAIKEDAA